jgi:hypothetical protein
VFTLGQLPLNDKVSPPPITMRTRSRSWANLTPPQSAEPPADGIQTLLWRYPQHAAAIRDLLSVWRTAALIENNTQSQAAVLSTGRWPTMNSGTLLATVSMPAIRCA